MLRKLWEWLKSLFGSAQSTPEIRPGEIGCPRCSGDATLIEFVGYEMYACSCGWTHGLEKVIERSYDLDDFRTYLAEEVRVALAERTGPNRISARVEDVFENQTGATVYLKAEKGTFDAGSGDRDWLVETSSGSSGGHDRGSGMILGYAPAPEPDQLKLLIPGHHRTSLREGQIIHLTSPGDAIFPARLEVVLDKYTAAARRYGVAGGIPIQSLIDPSKLPRVPQGRPIEGGRLNDSQRRAIGRAVEVPEGGIFLIQGPPGTGKTTIIIEIIKRLLEEGHSVWATGHTQIAVENVLKKAARNDSIREQGIIRIPEEDDEIQEMINPDDALEAARLRMMAVDQDKGNSNWQDPFTLARFARALTTSTLDSAALQLLKYGELPPRGLFDFAIMDEASMNLLPKVAVAAACSKRLILVGDHRQLQAVVNAPSFEGRLDFERSLFEIIQHDRPDLLELLDTQYRSVDDLMDWGSELLYEGNLQDGRGERPPGFRLHSNRIETPTLWLDTEGLGDTPIEYEDDSYRNDQHARLACETLHRLIQENEEVSVDELAVIAPFKPQARVIRQRWQELYGSELGHLDTGTVDAFQGRDYRAVLYDLTTNEPKVSHANPMRLNVALSRAEDLCIILGRKDFASDPLANPFFWSLGKHPAVDVRCFDEARPDGPPGGDDIPLDSQRASPPGQSDGQGSTAPAQGPAEPVATYDDLRALRMERARAADVRPYVICHNATLERILEERPRTKEELSEIKGIGPAFLDKHAEAFLKALWEPQKK